MKKQTLKQWLKKTHPAIHKEWMEINKARRREYIKEWMRDKYYHPKPAPVAVPKFLKTKKTILE